MLPEEKLREPVFSYKQTLEIFSLLSHEIRTPLNAIIGISELLNNQYQEANREDYYKVLKTTSENLLELVNNILDYSKLESGPLPISERIFNIRKKLKHCLYSQKQIAIGKGLVFNLEIDPQIPYLVQGDQVKVCQIFINLISNAIKFTNEGEVEISLLLEKEDEKSIGIECKVRDTGIGIPESQLKRVFRAFHQGEDDINILYSGTGLGLSITKNLVKMLGGNISVESEVGSGTCFTFYLHFGKTDKKEEDTSAMVEKGLLKGKKVLLVEDNKINIMVVSRFLELWHMKYEIARDGVEAIEKIEYLDYDIVLMDLQMPKMGGIEALENIRQFQNEKIRNLPVIALTATTDITEENLFSENGFDGYLVKPFESVKLKDILSTYCK